MNDPLYITPIRPEDFKAMVRECLRDELQAHGPSTAESPERILTTKELCEEFKISRPTTIEMRKRGELPYFLVGNRIRFVFGDVVKALRDNQSNLAK